MRAPLSASPEQPSELSGPNRPKDRARPRRSITLSGLVCMNGTLRSFRAAYVRCVAKSDVPLKKIADAVDEKSSS